MEAESGNEAVIIFFLHHTRNFLISATCLFTVESALDFNNTVMKAFLFNLQVTARTC